MKKEWKKTSNGNTQTHLHIMNWRTYLMGPTKRLDYAQEKKEGCLIEAADFFSILGWEKQLSFLRLWNLLCKCFNGFDSDYDLTISQSSIWFNSF